MKRTWAKEVHPLAAEDCPCGKIRFIHSDGVEHSFGFATNSLSNSILAYFDGSAPTIEPDHAWIKSVVKKIYAKSQKVLEHIGDYRPTGQ